MDRPTLSLLAAAWLGCSSAPDDDPATLPCEQQHVVAECVQFRCGLGPSWYDTGWLVGCARACISMLVEDEVIELGVREHELLAEEVAGALACRSASIDADLVCEATERVVIECVNGVREF